MLAERLAQRCTLQMTDHQWATANVAAARQVLAEPAGQATLDALASRLARTAATGPGWAVVALPERMGDEDLQQAAAGLLAVLGRPFFSIEQGSRLWIGGDSSPDRGATSFGGFGEQALHIDAPNVERVPDYTSLLLLQPDPAGGGTSVIADLPAALARTSEADRAVLARPDFFEGRADGLRGVGRPLLPFPVLAEPIGGDRPWIRWAAKMVDDPRNSGHAEVLRRFAQAVQAQARAVTLGRGQLLIADQQRIAHGRMALGPVSPDGARRRLLQAKVSYDPGAPAQLRACVVAGAGGRNA